MVPLTHSLTHTLTHARIYSKRVEADREFEDEDPAVEEHRRKAVREAFARKLLFKVSIRAAPPVLGMCC